MDPQMAKTHVKYAGYDLSKSAIYVLEEIVSDVRCIVTGISHFGYVIITYQNPHQLFLTKLSTAIKTI